MNDELDKIWKETGCNFIETLIGVFPEEWMNSSKKTSAMTDEIRTNHLPNSSLKCYRFAYPFSTCAVYPLFRWRWMNSFRPQLLYCRRKSTRIKRIGGRAIAQAVSRWLPTAALRGSKPDLVMWDLWWDKVALGQVFSEFFGFPCNHRSFHQLLHNHSHVSSGECTIGQCGCSAGTYRDLGDMNKET
jgi:hypothetical protein